MSFDFLGTFNKSQFDRLAAFARSQLADAGGRLLHLVYEKLRVGALVINYDDGGSPTGYTVSDSKSTYIGRLVSAYEVLGGDVLHDLQVRSKAQSVFLRAATDTSNAQFLSSGDVMGTRGLGDAPSAEYVRQVKSWMTAPLHYRREYLERKIRRALDYAEQLETELEAIKQATSEDASVEGSLGYVVRAVEELIQDFNYRAVSDDKGRDPHGRTTYAPLLPYSKTGADPEKVSPDVTMAGRDDDGFKTTGEVR